MSGVQHTLGWTLTGDHDWWECRVSFSGSGQYYTIYEQGRSLPVAFSIGGDRSQARLIAAAPDLLEAVWALIEHFERVDGDAAHKAVIAKGTAAIARARGEQDGGGHV